MASVLKAQTANASKVDAKGKGKRKADEMEVDEVAEGQTARAKKNKQRVLLLSSRGITHRMRHLMNDLEALLPHVKKGRNVNSASFDTKKNAERILHLKTRNSTRNHSLTFSLNWLISTIATIPCTLRRGDTRICTCGLQRHQTDLASNSMSRTFTPWMN